MQSPVRKCSQIFKKSVSLKKLVRLKNGGWRKKYSPIEQQLSCFGRRKRFEVSQRWLVDQIPVLERCFWVSFEHINRPEKFRYVRVRRSKAHCSAQIALRGGEIIQPVFRASTLSEESRVSRRFADAVRKSITCFCPSVEMRKSHTRVVIEIGGLSRWTLR